MSKRLKSGHWLDAYRWRLAANFIPFYVTRKGDQDAGAIFIRVHDQKLFTPQYDYETDARKWAMVAEGEAITGYLARLEKSDPDFWLLDVEEGGEEQLFTDGL